MYVIFMYLHIYIYFFLCIFIAYRFLVMLRDLILYTYSSCSAICSRFFLCIRFATSFRFRLGLILIGCGSIASNCCFCSFSGFSFSFGCSFGFSCRRQRAGLGICKTKLTSNLLECCLVIIYRLSIFMLKCYI